MGSIQTWEQTVTEKRSLRDRTLEPYMTIDIEQRPPRIHNVHHRTCIHDDPTIQEITDIDSVPILLDRIERGQYTAEQVSLAYIKRATIAHQLINCLTEVVFEDALEQARRLDQLFREKGQLAGPLHGIPVTLKDQFNIKGVDTTLGYVGRSFAPASEDAVLVEMLKGMGAVILAKTNLPQSIMWAETENPLWGLTVNPRNPLFTPGGSTGGEGALLALHGSILGFGTDIGGSIRIPQSINGLAADFLTTASRSQIRFAPKFPSRSTDWICRDPIATRVKFSEFCVTEGQEHVPSSIGPMTRDLSSLSYVCRIFAKAKPWTLDPKCAPLPWNEDSFRDALSRPLVVGLILDDGVVKTHPPVQRALRELSTKLESQGHEVVVWDASDHFDYIKLMDQYYTADGCEDIRRDVEVAGEPFIPHVEALINRGEAISVYEYWQLNKQKTTLQKRYLDKWNAVQSPSGKPVDILLGPTMPHAAVPHRSVRWVGYTKIWNLLDYPAVTFAVDQVRADRDRLPGELYRPRNELDEWNWGLYDPLTMDGHPINLQIVGKKLEDEKVLGAATVIEKIWRAAKP